MEGHQNNHPYRFSCSIDSFAELGDGYCLYFLFLRFCLLLLGILAFFVALPLIFIYFSSNRCPENPCSAFLQISIANDIINHKEYYFKDFANLFATVSSVILYRWFYIYLHRNSVKFDELALTPAGIPFKPNPFDSLTRESISFLQSFVTLPSFTTFPPSFMTSSITLRSFTLFALLLLLLTPLAC